MRIATALSTMFLALPVPSSVLAHEFWIEPLAYQIEAGGMMQAELINGQEFSGVQLAFLPQRFSQFTVNSGIGPSNVENRIGARPALDMPPPSEGLTIVGYVSTMSTVGYAEWNKFLTFSEHKDFQDIQARHDARDLPRDGFDEGYWRFAKSLIGVGNSIGSDFRTGLAVEFVALDNPYTDDLSDGLRVQLFYQDDVIANGQVEMFEKSRDGDVEVTLHRTDANGLATLPVQAGHSYLLDHVVLREPDTELAAQADIAWETLWGALTFGVPE